MRRESVRLSQNLRAWLGIASLEELYVLARELRVDLARRGLGAEIEAASVECALIAELVHLDRTIYSEDCETLSPLAARMMARPATEYLGEPPPAIES